MSDSMSRFLSLVLRHRPQVADVKPDAAGWVTIDSLIAGAQKAGRSLDYETLVSIVASNDKQRFQFDDSGLKIRAVQGHSINVTLNHRIAKPPAVLLHGTVSKFLPSIRASGLLKQKRHHVHLHESRKVASDVGARRGVPVVLSVDAEAMAADGFQFCVTPNGVWLTDHVPPEFIEFPDE